MAPSDVVVACCQVPLAVGDIDGNRTALGQAVQEAARAGANIVVLPELAATGYCFESRGEVEAVAEQTTGATIRAWHRWAAEHDIVLVGGFVEVGEKDHLYNSAAVVDASGLRAVYRKVHLWHRESEFFSAGTEPPPVVPTSFGRIGIVICYDLEFPEWVRIAALAGAEVLCAPVNWPLFVRPPEERPAEVVKAQANAAVNRIYVVACDRARSERGTQWLGGSVIIDPDGFPLTQLRLGDEGRMMARIDVSAASQKMIGERNDVFRDRRAELYGPIQAGGAACAD